MSSSSTLLHGKKVVILGGSSGIGRAVAAASLSNGASVVISSSGETRVQTAIEILKQVPQGGGGDLSITGEAVDIRDAPALTKFLRDNGPFDHLIFTAGDQSSLGMSYPDVDINETIKGQFDTRYWAPMIGTQFAHKNNLINSGGSITMTMGVSFNRPIPGWALISGVMGAVESATRGLALDLKPTRVNTVNPGLVATEFWDSLPYDARESMYDSGKKKMLVEHVGTPDELAEAYIFAMKCSYFTGQTITVDGGGVLV